MRSVVHLLSESRGRDTVQEGRMSLTSLQTPPLPPTFTAVGLGVLGAIYTPISYSIFLWTCCL